ISSDESPKTVILDEQSPRSNSTSNEDFTEVFLAHVCLYSFADKYLIQPLRSLALHKLHQTLKGFKLYHTLVGDIIELARYAYPSDHTPDRNEDGTIDGLQQLITEYIAYEADVIGKSMEFSELMEEGGQFVGDFWRIVQTCLVQ
ncbi:hypothetical protein K469DRAFT_604966, partial [Zopfia rhizophila CBS 207.26]